MHRADTTETTVANRRRTLIMALALMLFLPPLSVLFQFTADSNFCGTWCPRMFFVWRKGTGVDAYFMGYLRSYLGVALVAGILLSTFLWGRYWCSHLCPIGGAMELGSRCVPRFLKTNLAKIPAPAFRYGYLTVYFGAAALGWGSLCCAYCNFAAVPRLIAAPFSSADMAYFLRTAGLINLALVMLLGFFARGGRAYCNLLCPIGALDALSNRAGARWGRRMRVRPVRCAGCGICLDSCPVWAIDISEKVARIDALSCIPCGACETVCPQGAIDYRSSVGLPERNTVHETV